MTHESRAVVAEGGLHVGGLLEVMDEAHTQLGADDAGSHEVGCDFLPADETLPAGRRNKGGGVTNKHIQTVTG